MEGHLKTKFPSFPFCSKMIRFHTQKVKIFPEETSLQFSVSVETRTVFENPRATPGTSASYLLIYMFYRLKPDELELPSTQELKEYLTKNQKKGEH